MLQPARRSAAARPAERSEHRSQKSKVPHYTQRAFLCVLLCKVQTVRGCSGPERHRHSGCSLRDRMFRAPLPRASCGVLSLTLRGTTFCLHDSVPAAPTAIYIWPTQIAMRCRPSRCELYRLHHALCHTRMSVVAHRLPAFLTKSPMQTMGTRIIVCSNHSSLSSRPPPSSRDERPAPPGRRQVCTRQGTAGRHPADRPDLNGPCF